MAASHAGVYLNDHLAGSEVALQLLAQLETTHAGDPVATLASELRAEITADRCELEALVARLSVVASKPRQAVAWLAEKTARMKLSWDDSAAGPLRLLEVLEALSLGIEGKRQLWRSLRIAAEESTAYRGPDYDQLERRAEQQRCRVEALRLDAAKVVLASIPSASHATGFASSEGR